MRMLCWHLLIYLLVGGRALAVDSEPEFAEAREGSDAELPCSLQPVHPPDKVNLVVWHKGDDEAALYKYDMRGARGQHWADPSVGDRYFLRLLDGERALLTISLTRLSDEALYHCRVDFNRSPTRYTHVNLTVVVPPQGVQISDESGFPIKNGITKAYADGASLSLTCTASGGKPPAQVSWWRDGELVTDETQFLPDRAKSQNVLKIIKLTRAHLLAVYSCEVSNSRLQPPLVVRVAVDMFLRPLEVKLQGDNQPLSAGRRYDIVCKCKGSRPPAVIGWMKNSHPNNTLNQVFTLSSEDLHKTVGLLNNDVRAKIDVRNNVAEDSTKDNKSEKTASILEGRRIVDINFFINSIITVSNHCNIFNCTLQNMQFIKEERLGFASMLHFKCNMCNGDFQISTCENIKRVNNDAVLAVMAIGSGFSHLEQISTSLDLPCMSERMYGVAHDEVSDGWEEISMKAMKDAAEEEETLAIDAGDIHESGIPMITVVADGVGQRGLIETTITLCPGQLQ